MINQSEQYIWHPDANGTNNTEARREPMILCRSQSCLRNVEEQYEQATKRFNNLTVIVMAIITSPVWIAYLKVLFDEHVRDSDMPKPGLIILLCGLALVIYGLGRKAISYIRNNIEVYRNYCSNEILIVDEALSVGDVFFQAKCFKKFEDFKKEGKTILFVSHDLSSVQKYCDRVVLLNKGNKLAEGSAKDMVNLYKKVLVNRLADTTLSNEDNPAIEGRAESIVDQHADDAQTGRSGGRWRDHFEVNPNLIEYGNKEAELIDFAIVDADGMFTSSIEKGTRFTVKSKTLFHQTIRMPIFTLTFKDIHGTSITGTNTMYEKKDVEEAKEGEIYVAEFTQEMNLQGGEYLVSMSCTGYANGEFTVYHRLYDVLNLTVVSDKDTVGFYDMNSEVTVTKVEA